MSILKPYKRNWRPMLNYPNGNSGYSSWAYIVDERYATDGMNYLQSYRLIEKDIINLFEYIEPSDINLKTYSHRIHSLIIRLCIEIESNFKAILDDNCYSRNGDLDMNDYKKIYKTHRLSSYAVKIKNWSGEKFIYRPFESWDVNLPDISKKSLNWYRSYHAIKHNKHKEFELANLENLILAASGLIVLLCSQFGKADLSDSAETLSVCSGAYKDDGFSHCQSNIFKIKFPNDFPNNEKYDFDWSVLSKDNNPFQKLF